MTHNILLLSAVGVLGGAERSLLQLVRALDRDRFRPIAALPDGPLAAELRVAGAQTVPIEPLRLRRTLRPDALASAGAGVARAAAGVARAARAHRVALLHANTTTAHLVGAAAGALTHVPCVWHVRDLHTPALLRDTLGPAARAIVCISGAVRDSLGASGASARVIWNGIDADAFAAGAGEGDLRAELGLGSAPLVLMVAQMVPWKGHGTLLRALKTLRDALPDACAAIAGGDLFGENAEYEAALRREAANLGLGEAVHWLGWRTDVADLMAACDVVAVPSDAEPFGRVALEAMAMGRAVVGTRAGGLPEVVADGETGLLVPPGDAPALSEALRRVLEDASLRAKMGEAGAQRVRERFSAAAHARAVESLYDEILRGR